MKTKNFLLTGALLIMALFSVNGVMAADPVVNNKEASVNVNLIFKPVQSIQVNPLNGGTEIDFVYQTANDYLNGIATQTKAIKDHLIVNHTGAFNVTVSSPGFLNGVNALTGDNHVTLEASNGTKFRDGTSYSGPVSLGDTDTAEEAFISSPNGGIGLMYNVEYKPVSDDNLETYIDLLSGNSEATSITYTAEVTYTIVSK